MNSTETLRRQVHALIRRRQPGDLEEAATLLSGWADRDAASPEPWQRLFEIHIHERQFAKALEALERFEQLRGDPVTALYLRAVLLHLDGNMDDALHAYREAIRLGMQVRPSGSPNTAMLDAPALDVAAAMQACETASGAYPGSSERQEEGMFDGRLELENLENSLLRWEHGRGKPQSRETNEKFSDAWYNLGCAALASYTADDHRIELFRRAVDLNPQHVLARLNRVFAANYSTNISPEQSAAAHLELGQWLEARYGAGDYEFGNDRSPGRRLRVGYLSSDFRNHSVASFILPVIERHDPGKIELFIYYNHARKDELTRRARLAAGHFRATRDLSDAELCNLIRDDAIDLLIDLNGLTQYNRMPVLAMRAAPVQITWLGYPNTTGLRTVDYRVVDRTTDPPGDASSRHAEQLMYLPRTFSVYEAPGNLPPVVDAPGRRAGFITFGSFNSLPKLNEDLVATWSQILRRVNGSRILMKNLAFSFQDPRRVLLDAFKRHGIDATRVAFEGYAPDKSDHLGAYGRIDIALDTYPYNGTTTTCESLVMGVPVISRAGRDHRSRVGASLLDAAGLKSLVSNDESAYIDAAIGLASDREQLRVLRSSLRERMRSSALMDADTFTRDFERELFTAWERWCQAGT